MNPSDITKDLSSLLKTTTQHLELIKIYYDASAALGNKEYENVRAIVEPVLETNENTPWALHFKGTALHYLKDFEGMLQ